MRYTLFILLLLLSLQAHSIPPYEREGLEDKPVPSSATTTPPPYGEGLGGSPRMHSTLYGFGFSNVLDTYLSPYSYKGIEARVIRQTARRTKLWQGRISYHTQIDFNAAYVKNPAKNVKEYAGGIRYSNAWLYNFTPLPDGSPHRGGDVRRTEGVSLAVGPAASGYLGCIYNSRNGNNPAQARVDVMIDLTAQVAYRFRVGRRHWLAKYDLAVPFLGVAFSPQYGQSYYEMFSLKDYDHNCVFANPVNMPSMRHLLTVDIPIGHNQLRVGYAGEFMQSKFNGLRYHSYSHNLMIGFTKYFVRK